MPCHWPKRGVASEHPQDRALSESRKRNQLGCFPSSIFIQRNGKKKPKPKTKPTFTEQTSENQKPERVYASNCISSSVFREMLTMSCFKPMALLDKATPIPCHRKEQTDRYVTPIIILIAKKKLKKKSWSGFNVSNHSAERVRRKVALLPFAAGSSPPPASSPQPREPPKLKVEEICCCYFHPGSTLRVRTCEVRGLGAGGAPRGRQLGLPQVLALPGCPGVTFHPEQPPETSWSS